MLVFVYIGQKRGEMEIRSDCFIKDWIIISLYFLTVNNFRLSFSLYVYEEGGMMVVHSSGRMVSQWGWVTRVQVQDLQWVDEESDSEGWDSGWVIWSRACWGCLTLKVGLPGSRSRTCNGRRVTLVLLGS
jgi:hypothetical protein